MKNIFTTILSVMAISFTALAQTTPEQQNVVRKIFGTYDQSIKMIQVAMSSDELAQQINQAPLRSISVDQPMNSVTFHTRMDSCIIVVRLKKVAVAGDVEFTVDSVRNQCVGL